MIRLPTRSRPDGEDESFPSAAATWRLEWEERDEQGQPLPPHEVIARFVTPYGVMDRRIRLRGADESPGA